MSQQIAALLKPRPREAEITTTSTKSKFGFVQATDFQHIGIKEVTLRPNVCIAKNLIKVKVSLA
jgi:hypothetical protein